MSEEAATSLLAELSQVYGNPRIDRVVLRDRFDVRIREHRVVGSVRRATELIGESRGG